MPIIENIFDRISTEDGAKEFRDTCMVAVRFFADAYSQCANLASAEQQSAAKNGNDLDAIRATRVRLMGELMQELTQQRGITEDCAIQILFATFPSPSGVAPSIATQIVRHGIEHAANAMGDGFGDGLADLADD